jgi:hypothetical protein
MKTKMNQSTEFMLTNFQKKQTELKLENLENKLKNYLQDFELLKFEKQLLENRIIRLRNKIENLQQNED